MGSVARHELAAAVSEAGGLGTIAGVGAPIAAEIAAARELTGRPIAANLLLPFVRPGDAEAAKLPVFADKAHQGAVSTYICQNYACQAPLIGADAAEQALGK